MRQSTNERDTAMPIINSELQESNKEVIKKKHNWLFYFILFIIPFISIKLIYDGIKTLICLANSVDLENKEFEKQFKIINNVEKYEKLNNFNILPIKEMEILYLTSKKIFESNNVDTRLGRDRICLLTGDTGTGKTYFIKLFSNYIYKRMKEDNDKRNVCLINLTVGHILNPISSLTVKNLSSIFKFIEKNQEEKLIILVFDDADTLFEINGEKETVNSHLFSGFKTQLLSTLGGNPKIDSLSFICLFSLIPKKDEIQSRWTRRCGIEINLNEIDKNIIISNYCKFLLQPNLSSKEIENLFPKEKYSIEEILEKLNTFYDI